MYTKGLITDYQVESPLPPHHIKKIEMKFQLFIFITNLTNRIRTTRGQRVRYITETNVLMSHRPRYTLGVVVDTRPVAITTGRNGLID